MYYSELYTSIRAMYKKNGKIKLQQYNNAYS